MKHTLKRLTVLLLIVTILCACLAPSAAATDSKADIQQAIVETAMAYYYKGIKAQYDNAPMTTQTTVLRNKLYGELRTTDGEPPEWASDDHTLYMVCAGLVYDTILNTLGYKLTGSGRTCLTINLSNEVDPSAPGVIFHTGGKYGGDFDEAAAKATIDILEPGDIIAYCNLANGTGHTGIYVGDVLGDGKGYFVNSGGSKINMSTGVDKIEGRTTFSTSYGGGTVRLDDVTSSSTGYGTKSMAGWHSFTIIRPTVIAQELGLSLTPAARARLAYPGIEVDRTFSAKQYDTVTTGDEITVTVTVRNHGNTDYHGVSVSEPLPTGAEVVASSVQNGSVSGNAVIGSLNVPAGGSATLRYTATVTGARGTDVSFPSGTAAGALVTRPTSVRIGGKDWNAANAAIFAELAGSSGAGRITSLPHNSDLDFVNSFYREFFGLDLGLPEKTQVLRDTQMRWTEYAVLGSDTSEFGGCMLQPYQDSVLTEQGKHIRQMILPEHMAGWNVYLRESLTEIPEEDGAQNRVMEIKEENYRPGDVFIGYVHKNRTTMSVYRPDVYIYLGNGKVAGIAKGSDSAGVESFSDNVGKFLRQNVFFVLRPRLAYDDVNIVDRIIMGDVDRDGIVTGKDVTTLRRWIVGGYGVTSDKTVADVNYDSVVNGKDVTTLRRYLVGGYGVDIDTPPVIDVTSVALNRTELSLTAGKTFTLTTEILPANASEKTVTWTSSVPAVAAVDGGVITALSAGTTVVTATAGGRTAACTVMVLTGSGGDNRLPGIPIN